TLNVLADVYVGFAVTSHNESTLCDAQFDYITFRNPGAPPPPPPSPTLAAPTSLSATPISSSQINLTWVDNSSDEDGFEVERSTDGTTFIGIGAVAANTTTFSSEGLSASTRYLYRVRATR